MSSLKSPALAFSGRYLTIIPHDLINYEWAAVFRCAILSPRSEMGWETEPKEARIKPASAAELLIKYEISWKCGKTLKNKCLWVLFIRHQEIHVSVAVWRSSKRKSRSLLWCPSGVEDPRVYEDKKQKTLWTTDLICSQLCKYMVLGKCFFQTDFRVLHVPQRGTEITDFTFKYSTIQSLGSESVFFFFLKKMFLIL